MSDSKTTGSGGKLKGLISSIDPNGWIAPHVHKEMFAENRKRLIDAMNAKAATESKDSKAGAVEAIVLEGGVVQNKYDTDMEYIFRQESHFFYLFGCPEADCFGAIDLATKSSILFIPKLGVEYEIWCGKVKPCDFYKEKYGVEEVRYTEEMSAVLKARNVSVIHTLVGTNTDSGSNTKPAHFKGIESFTVNPKRLYPVLCENRVTKTARELDLMRYVNRVSSEAHVQVMREAKTVKSEHELEAIFQYHTYRFAQCRHMSYTCICCSGDNSAVLHYGHTGAPNDKPLDHANDMLLLDMGAEYHGYASDITCSYPASGKFSPAQKQVYEAVLDAQQSVMRELKPGVRWADMHRLAEKVILEHLHRHGIVVLPAGSGITLHDLQYKYHIGALFMPHGLGHLLGLDTHDVGGYLGTTAAEGVDSKTIAKDAEIQPKPTDPGVKKLRFNRILKPGMVLTVEPGCYFIEALLGPALASNETARFLNAAKIKQFLSFGGVRLEDDVIITATGSENMTKCPRTVEEVESVMAGGAWPTIPRSK